jgi:hypothetical protein
VIFVYNCAYDTLQPHLRYCRRGFTVAFIQLQKRHRICRRYSKVRAQLIEIEIEREDEIQINKKRI